MLFILKFIPYAIVLYTLKLCEKIASYLGFTENVSPPDKDLNQENFAIAVQRRSILWKYKISLIYSASPTNFISWPSGICDYKTLLKDNVSLYCITPTEAWFVETPKDTDVYSSDSDPFLYISQFKLASKLYVIPLQSLIALGDFIGHPKVPVILLSSHGRCGSTLLTQAFETNPGALTFGEPDAFTNAMSLKWNDRPTKEYLQSILTAIMKIMCREMPTRKVSLYCIKTRSTCIGFVDLIAEKMPEVKNLYLYRNCADSVASMEHSFSQGTEIGRLIGKILKVKWFRSILYWIYPDLPEEKRTIMSLLNLRYNIVFNLAFMASATPLGFWTVNWGITCAEYLRLRRDGVKIAGIRYEDFVSNTETVIQGLTQYTGIKLDPKVIITEVMKKDSQRGTEISKDKLASFNRLVPDDKTKEEMKYICEVLGLPEPDQTTLLEGTIAVNL